MIFWVRSIMESSLSFLSGFPSTISPSTSDLWFAIIALPFYMPYAASISALVSIRALSMGRRQVVQLWVPLWILMQKYLTLTFSTLFHSKRFDRRLVLSGPAGPFCVGCNFNPCRICTRSTWKSFKKLEKQNWWSTTETSYAATNFQPIHLRYFHSVLQEIIYDIMGVFEFVWYIGFFYASKE